MVPEHVGFCLFLFGIRISFLIQVFVSFPSAVFPY